MSVDIAIFQNDSFSRKWPEGSDADLERDPWGRDCAEFLMVQLSAANVAARTGEPVEGEGGWSFTVEMLSCTIKVFVMWAPIGDPPEDYWTVHLRKAQSPLMKLFRKQESNREWLRIRSLIETILTSDPATKNFRWVTLEEFKRLY